MFLGPRTTEHVHALLAAVGYDFSLLLNWLRLLFAFFLALFATAAAPPVQPRSA